MTLKQKTELTQNPVELAKAALRQVLDYREGNGKFNLSHIANHAERRNESLDLWYEVEADIRNAIIALETL